MEESLPEPKANSYHESSSSTSSLSKLASSLFSKVQQRGQSQTGSSASSPSPTRRSKPNEGKSMLVSQQSNSLNPPEFLQPSVVINDEEPIPDDSVQKTNSWKNQVPRLEIPGEELENEGSGGDKRSPNSFPDGRDWMPMTSSRMVPRSFLGAIPRRTQESSRSSSMESEEGASATSATKRCFCGYYSEVSKSRKKPGRCKFCRSKAKYVPGQRSFDAARFFGQGRQKDAPRRAVSEDQRSDGHTTEDTSASTSSATTAHSSFDRQSPSSRPSHSSFFSTPPFLRRQERLDPDLPSPNFLTVPTSPTMFPGSIRDHGLRTPPAPPSSPGSSRQRRLIQGDYERALSHQMAHDLPEYLIPPPRSAILGRAHTDPESQFQEQQYMPISSTFCSNQVHQVRGPHPASPPPAYSEVIKEPRQAPPSYEEALNSRLNDLRMSTNTRTHSEERTTSTSGHFAPRSSTRSSRISSRPLMRSSRAEEIPDVYWEQAARELDFCTCRKCQARYRQYFEEDLSDPVSDAMIPMETQVLMQEVLTDGIAFCSLM